MMRETALEPLVDATYTRSIDFGAAGLYLVGIQAIIVNIACAVAAILCCWLLPRAAVSAVRTLTVCVVIAFLGMYKAIRVGKVAGVDLLFTALQPLAPLYITALVIEQLVHTCAPAPDDVEDGIGWRRILFQLFVALMMISGFVRAATPNSELDFGFALTSCALVAVALLPPPALPLAGPLCEPSSLYLAGERILRATFFSMLYSIHVYVAPPQRHDVNELMLCVLRSSAASVWVLGAHPLLLIASPLQAAVAIYKRFGRNECLQYAAMSPADDDAPRTARQGFREFRESDDDAHDDLEASAPIPDAPPTPPPPRNPARTVKTSGCNMSSNSTVATAAMLLSPPEPYVPMEVYPTTEGGFRDLTNAPSEPSTCSASGDAPHVASLDYSADMAAPRVDDVDLLLSDDGGIPLNASQLKSFARPIATAGPVPHGAAQKRLFSIDRIPDRTSV